MKNLTKKMMAVVLLSAVLPVFAADNSVVPKASSMMSIKTPETVTTDGSISAVDLKANTLKLLVAGGKSVEVSIKGAEVMLNGKKAALTDLKIGQKVKVRHVGVGNAQVAKTIIVQ